MKVLLDEGVPQPLLRHLLAHNVQTVSGSGWSGIKNGQLLKLIEAEGVEVFITGDKNLSYQQNVLNSPFATLVLSTIHWPVLRKNIASVTEALAGAQPGDLTIVDCGEFVPQRRRRGEA